jgi:hypothetical protein
MNPLLLATYRAMQRRLAWAAMLRVGITKSACAAITASMLFVRGRRLDVPGCCGVFVEADRLLRRRGRESTPGAVAARHEALRVPEALHDEALRAHGALDNAEPAGKAATAWKQTQKREIAQIAQGATERHPQWHQRVA